ncbi:hypothetical protein GCM10027596_02390 [Nocardioides korecus]
MWCALLLPLTLAAPASADSGDFPRATKTDGKRNYVWVGEGIYQKVTGYHAVPGWLVGRIIYYGHEGALASGYSPYYLTVHEYECNQNACRMTSRMVNIRMVIDWGDGRANHGVLRTMYCHMRVPRKTWPSWLQSDDPYLGPPGPQHPRLSAQ